MHTQLAVSFLVPEQAIRLDIQSWCLWVSGSIAPRIVNLGTRWRSVVSFTLRPLYSRDGVPA
jgi:hypothetical protein